MNSQDLRQFCGTDEQRTSIQAPFTRGPFTYATNGHVLVRVPRLDDVPQIEGTPHAEVIFDKAARQEVGPPPVLTLPPYETEECDACSEGEAIHDCPNCNCSCEECGDTREIEVKTSCTVNGEFFDTKYMHQLLTLPGFKFSKEPPPKQGARFEFDGGEGYLMPLARQYPRHVDADGTVTTAEDED